MMLLTFCISDQIQTYKPLINCSDLISVLGYQAIIPSPTHTLGCGTPKLRLVFVPQLQDPSVAAASSASKIAAKTSSEILYGGDLIKVPEQMQRLTEKAVASDLQNPQESVISKLSNVSNVDFLSCE